jgi:hypothetical protein
LAKTAASKMLRPSLNQMVLQPNQPGKSAPAAIRSCPPQGGRARNPSGGSFAQEKRFLTALLPVRNDKRTFLSNLFVHDPISPGIRPMRIPLTAIEIKNGSGGSALRPETNH